MRNCSTKRQFSAKVGTIFEESPLPLEQWLVAVWLEVNAKNSISSYELHRALGITQKSAWFMLHRVRLALQSGSFSKMGGSGGVIEADETYVGGLARNMHKHKRTKAITGRGGSNKTAVMGLLERHAEKGKSKVRTAIIQNTGKRAIQNVITENVEPGTSIYTDAFGSYRSLKDDYIHAFIDHAEKYVDGRVHTNGLENFWSLFKRCIKGTHVSIEPFHLTRYVDAEAFRFNNRDIKDGGRFTLALQGVSGKRLTYDSLIGKTSLEGLAASVSTVASARLPN